MDEELFCCHHCSPTCHHTRIIPFCNTKGMIGLTIVQSYLINVFVPFVYFPVFLFVKINMDGKNTAAMRKVVNKIPSVIVKPNKNSSCKGWVIRTPNVAARIKPAEEKIGRASCREKVWIGAEAAAVR